MSRYVPILKGKSGELDALSHKKPFANSEMLPVFDLVTSDPDKGKLPHESETFAKSLVKKLPSSSTPLGLDTTYLPSNRHVRGQRPLRWLTAELHANLPSGYPIVPVVHEDSSALHLGDVGDAARTFGAGIMLRLGSDSNLPAPLSKVDLAAILAGAGVAIGDVDIIVDYRSVQTSQRLMAAQAGLTSMWAWASGLNARSLTVSSGAFPASLAGMGWGNCTSLPRRDHQLWQTGGHAFDFADYGVTAPTASARGWGASPNLRYTAQNDWFVWREAVDKSGGEYYGRMHDIYVSATQHASWVGGSFSWGDDEISRRATGTRGVNNRFMPSLGNSTKWRAYATNHHLEKVVNQLATPALT